MTTESVLEPDSDTTQEPESETRITGNCESVGDLAMQALSRVPQRPQPPTLDQVVEMQREAIRQNKAMQDSRWRRTVERIGARYAECSFDNFVISKEPKTAATQENVLRRLREFADNPIRGRNVIFYGPKGTGKDHLMAALMRRANDIGDDVLWVNGIELFAEMRDAMDKEVSELAMIRRYTSPKVLAISDPLPPVGVLTGYQMGTLFQILDRRYRDMKAVWATVNFSGSKEGEERLGAQLMDRLKDGALALFCDWPSYRKAGD